MGSFPNPEVISCFFENRARPPFPAMRLTWPEVAATERTWAFPGRVMLTSPFPEIFGVTILRHQQDSYLVKVLWNQMFIHWHRLTRNQILASDLAPILQSLGTDLEYLLNQPITQETMHCQVA